MSPSSLFGRIAGRKVPLLLVVISFLGAGARIYQLGERVLYYDEAWFGYWTLKFLEHGAWEYRPILHGPFFVRINSIIFPILGISDFTAQLSVAVIGGLLPLSAWLFRDHLRGGEVIGLAIALAFNPILLYYSRFMRKDLPLAAFMFVTLGFLLRAYDTRRPRYLYAAGLSLGFAFATKESVLLWLLTWLGAGALILDRQLLQARDRDGNALIVFRPYMQRVRTCATRWWNHVVVAGGVFTAVIVYFYAPRAGPGQEIGLWKAIGGEFNMIPSVIQAATFGSFRKAIGRWVTGSIQQHPYLPYLSDTLHTLTAGALAISVLAIVGFLYDRYTGGAPRPVVAFNFYCGVAATVGYPLANHFPVPWSTVHAVVPLTVPAAVGAYVVYRWGYKHTPKRDSMVFASSSSMQRVARAGMAAVVLSSLGATAGVVAFETSYQNPHESPKGGDGGHEIVYDAQAPAELRSVITAINHAAATGGSDTDVLYVGSSLAMDESSVEQPPETFAWHSRIPLPWYTESAGADVDSIDHPDEISERPPEVVITTPLLRDEVAQRVGTSHTARKHHLGEAGDRIVVVFLKNSIISD